MMNYVLKIKIGEIGMYYIIDLLKDMSNLKSLDLSCIILYK